MSYNSENDPLYNSRPFPRTCFLHAWGWQVIEISPHNYDLITAEHRFIAKFQSKTAAIDYMNAEFLVT